MRRAASLAAALALLTAFVPAGLEPTPELRLTVGAAATVWIPGGWFTRGSDLDEARRARQDCALSLPSAGVEQMQLLLPRLCPDELFVAELTPRAGTDIGPPRRVFVTAFGVDRTEVTQAAYRRCVVANVCPPPELSDADARVSAPDHPVAGVRWSDARAYCAWVGGRLPTEAEWERAARGHDTRRFPWGQFDNPRLSNHGRFDLRFGPAPDGVDGYREAAPVGSFPDGRSPFGLLDMAGNVWEWTEDAFEIEAYGEGPVVDPPGPPSSGFRVVRGGSWRFPSVFSRVTQRYRHPEGSAGQDVGFRCAYDRETLATPVGGR